MMPKIMTIIFIVCMFMGRVAETMQSTEGTSTIGTIPAQMYTHHTALDRDDIFHLYWEPPKNHTPDSEITFKVELRAKGYFGLGFSPNGGMPGSDIVTGWIKDGQVYFQDRYATAFRRPPKDDQQDYQLLNAYENDTFTVFEFRRKLDTCDENDMVIEESTMRVIYAYSEEDPDYDYPFYHRRNRGSKSMMLLRSAVKEEEYLNLDSMPYWEIISPDVDITNHTTLYWCKIYKSPEVSEKQHIVYVKPMIEEGHESLLHHMGMSECVGGTAEVYEDLVDDNGAACFGPKMPEYVKNCRAPFVGWSIGNQGIVMPEHVGLPIFPGPSKYYMMQIHYDNPFRRTGLVDHSGFRLYYTDNVREFDAGLFVVGASIVPRVFIPPGQPHYVVAGHSNLDCFGPSFPEDGMNVIAISPHSHLMGQSVKIRHFRVNEELEPLLDEKYYDFNYQDYTYYPEEIKIFQKDQITVECTYDSSKRPNVTFGGFSSEEEMCVAFITYYPLANPVISYSAPTYNIINDVLNTSVTNNQDIYIQLGNYNWTNVDIDEVQNAMRYSKHQTQCSDGTSFPKGLPMVSYPDDLKPYEKETTCSSTK